MTCAACVSHTSDLEIVGPVDAPVIVVLGGISSSRHVTSSLDDPTPGWWENFVGRGKTIDTDRFRVASIDYDVPSHASRPVAASDHAAALSRALDSAGIGRVSAVVGTSYGGTVALAFAALERDRADRLIVYGACHESAAIAAARRILQRKVVELGVRAGFAEEALVIARGLAITTYSTAEAFEERFTATHPRQRRDEIARFLHDAGQGFSDRCSPEKFLELSQSLDSDWIDASRIRTPTTLIGVAEDAIVPIEKLRALGRIIGAECALEIVSSRFGHDAFLDDTAVIAPIVSRALQSSPAIVP